MNGKLIKRGFDRDVFFQKAEATFDRTFNYKRSIVESYHARKELVKNPQKYYSSLINLPSAEKAIAFKILKESGIPFIVLDPSKGLEAINILKKGIALAVKSSSLGV